MSFLYTILPFIFVLGAMIFIHELGHFAVAKFFKIRVDVFSLGFGTRLFGFKLGDTDYRISLIPLGGYVKMKGENLDEELENTGDEFLAKPAWQRLLVLFAGPFMNIITALAIPTVLAMFFFRVPLYPSEPAVIGSVAQESAAAAAGLQAGDKILLYDNKENPVWHDVEIKTDMNPERSMKIVVDRNGERIETTITPKVRYVGKEKIGASGLIPNFKQEFVNVDDITKGTPAEQAGLKKGDKIVALNGEQVKNFEWLRQSIQNLEGKEVIVSVERNSQKLDLKMKPYRQEGVVVIGFRPGAITPIPTLNANKPFFEAVKYSFNKNLEIVVLTKEALGQIFTGERKAKDALAGPISIAAISGEAFKRGGFESLFSLMALLSLNLGIFNLFPIPVLDGGHIFMIFLEGLLGLLGVKLSLSLKEKMMQFGFVMLVLLMGFVIFNDITKYFISSEPDRPAASAPASNQPSNQQNK
ncbi:MAG: RIP metalloprotease RseP [Blastocatellia bacterium]|nr:RIP metalloprotease RseP [Blastocatellia bacterium]